MNSKIILTLVIFYVIIASSCAKKTHGELTGRYASAKESRGREIDSFVGVEVYAFEPTKPAPPSKPLSVYQLPPEVLKQLISAFQKKDSTSALIIKNMASPLKLPSNAVEEDFSIDNRTVFNKRIVFTVSNKSSFPGDRISKLKITLTKPTNGIRFSSSSNMATETEWIDVGKLAFNRKSNFNIGINAGSGVSMSQSEKNISTNGNENNNETTSEESLANTTNKTKSTSGNNKETLSNRTAENKIGGNIGYSNEFSSNENVSLGYERAVLSASVKQNSVSVYREGAKGKDVKGNIVVDVELSSLNDVNNSVIAQPVFEFRNLSKDNVNNNPNIVTAKAIVVAYPDINIDINLGLSYEGVFRKITKFDNTDSESDDLVEFIQGKKTINSDSVLLLSKKEIVPEFWVIKNTADAPILIKPGSYISPIVLKFRSYSSALDFLNWLKIKATDFVTSGGKIANGTIMFYPGSGVASTFSANIIDGLSISIQE